MQYRDLVNARPVAREAEDLDEAIDILQIGLRTLRRRGK
jgi:hypothetical protein